MVRFRSSVVPFLVCVLVLPSTVAARDVLVCDMPWWTTEWNVVAHDPMGQQFTPSQSRLLSIELDLAEGSFRSEGTSLRLDVFEGGFDGTLLGQSAIVDLPDGFNARARFDFDPPLDGVAGRTLVFRITRTSAEGYAMVRGGSEDPCPGTSLWLLGVAAPLADLLFRIDTSTTVDVPPGTWSSVKALYGTSADLR